MRFSWACFLLVLCGAVVASTNAVEAGVVYSTNFGSYANGALIGQNGWTQYGADEAQDPTVAGGVLHMGGGPGTDAWNSYPTVTSGDAVMALRLRVTGPGSISNSSFATVAQFLSPPPPVGSDITYGWLRLRASGSGYQFFGRASGNPSASSDGAFGPVLPFSAQYVDVYLSYSPVQSTTTQRVYGWVNPVSDAVAGTLASSVTNPGYQSQSGFNRITLAEGAVSPTLDISRVVVATSFADAYAEMARVPEPSTLVLGSLGALGLIVTARRRAMRRNA